MIDKNDVSAIRNRLFSLTTAGIKYDLDRMREAVARCGNPQHAYPAIHVAGTNGKGSVCAFLDSCLRASGRRTGLFTSPHIVDFSERFMVDGKPVGEDVWVDVFRSLKPVIDDLGLTFFEAATLMAFELFRRERVEWAIFETGLGGRLDATNVIIPRVSVITRLALDHKEYLGSTLEQVAIEKLGIVKPQVPLVMIEPSSLSIKELATRHCQERGSPIKFVPPRTGEASRDGTGTTIEWRKRPYRITMPGSFQMENALLALEALDLAGLGERHKDLSIGIAAARLPGRSQIISLRGQTIVFDVGHNPDAAVSFCGEFYSRFKNERATLVVGIMRDKDFEAMMKAYAAIAERIVCVSPATDRAADAVTLASAVSGSRCIVTTASSVSEAMEEAFAAPASVIGVVGSFFTVGEAMKALGIVPYSVDLENG